MSIDNSVQMSQVSIF